MRVASRVGLAEDDPDMRGLIADALRKDGHAVLEFENGAALQRAMQETSERQLDLVVSDVRMPLVSGLAVLRSAREAGSRVPFILMTAFGDAALRREAVALRAVLLNKPFKLDEIRTTADALLARAGQ
jgi:DNA-binding response OmpR family regulator